MVCWCCVVYVLSAWCVVIRLLCLLYLLRCKLNDGRWKPRRLGGEGFPHSLPLSLLFAPLSLAPSSVLEVGVPQNLDRLLSLIPLARWIYIILYLAQGICQFFVTSPIGVVKYIRFIFLPCVYIRHTRYSRTDRATMDTTRTASIAPVLFIFTSSTCRHCSSGSSTHYSSSSSSTH